MRVALGAEHEASEMNINVSYIPFWHLAHSTTTSLQSAGCLNNVW